LLTFLERARILLVALYIAGLWPTAYGCYVGSGAFRRGPRQWRLVRWQRAEGVLADLAAMGRADLGW